MAYRLVSATGSLLRRGRTSAPRKITYDAKSAGRNKKKSTIEKKKSQKKEKKAKKDEVKKKGKSPYVPSDIPKSTNDQVYIDKMNEVGEGKGWILKCTLQLSSSNANEIQEQDALLTGGKGESLFHIIDVNHKKDVRLPTSPLENGMIKHDHKVIMPRTLRITGRVLRGFSQLLSDYFDKIIENRSLSVFFSLESPLATYPQMYLKAYTSKASAQKYDSYDYTLELQELLLASNLTDKTNDPDLASNTNKGAASGR